MESGMKSEKEASRSIVDSFARIIRIISIPPVMVTALIIILSVFRFSVFGELCQVLLAEIFLAVFPLLAYPLAYVVKPLRKKGREGEREAAFVLSFIGYLFGFAYSVISGQSEQLVFIYTIYFISVILLIAVNKIIKVRASGHGCSITGPCILFCVAFGAGGLIIGAGMYILVLWASLRTKRHTAREFILGSIVCGISAFISYIAVFIL